MPLETLRVTLVQVKAAAGALVLGMEMPQSPFLTLVTSWTLAFYPPCFSLGL